MRLNIVRKALFAILGLGIIGVVTILLIFSFHPDRFFAVKGLMLLTLKKNDNALSACNKAIELDSKSAPGLSCRIITLLMSERYNEVIVTSDKIIELAPNDPNIWQIWKIRGLALNNLNRYDEALDSLNISIKIKSNESDTLALKCSVLYKLEQYNEALETCNRSLEIDYNQYSVLKRRALIFLELKNYNDALSQYNLIINSNPKDSEAWNNRGVALENLKRYNQALRSFQKAIELDPNDTTAINNRERLLNR